MRRANVDCVIGTPQTVNILVNMKVLTWPLVAGGKGWGCVSLTKMRELGFQ